MVIRQGAPVLGDLRRHYRLPLPKSVPKRVSLAGRRLLVIHPGNSTKARVVVTEDEDGVAFVVKDISLQHPLVRLFYGRRLLRKEERVLRHLDRAPGVPRFLGRPDRDSIALEFMDGVKVRRKWHRDLMERAGKDMARKVASLHERGVVHLDLRQHKNILVTAAGHIALIDFESAVLLPPGSLKERMLRFLRRFDEDAVLKFQWMFAPGLLSSRDAHRARRAEWRSRLWVFHRIGPLLRFLLGGFLKRSRGATS